MRASDPNVTRRELAAAEAAEDVQKCIEICRGAMTTESNSDPKNLWHFGIKLAAFLKTRESASSQDVDEAIAVMEHLLAVVSRQDKPIRWAFLNSQLGAAILERNGDLSEALLHCENALEVLTREKNPEDWALAKRAAGDAYYRLAQDNDSISDLNKALTYYREALTVFTPEKYPDEGLIETIDLIASVLSEAREERKESL